MDRGASGCAAEYTSHTFRSLDDLSYFEFCMIWINFIGDVRVAWFILWIRTVYQREPSGWLNYSFAIRSHLRHPHLIQIAIWVSDYFVDFGSILGNGREWEIRNGLCNLMRLPTLLCTTLADSEQITHLKAAHNQLPSAYWFATKTFSISKIMQQESVVHTHCHGSRSVLCTKTENVIPQFGENFPTK